MKNRFTEVVISLLIIIMGTNTKIWGQNSSDSLSLQIAIHRALDTYPTVQQAQEAVQSARINKKMSESSYLPTLSGVASYTFIDPISKLDMNNQTIHIQSKNNSSVGLSLNQLIYDFGKTHSKVESARISEQLANLQKDQVMQNLTLQTIQSYYMTAYARQSITVKERQLEDYGRLLAQTEVKKNAGAATSFDYLNTNSEYNGVKTALIALNTAKEKQYVSLSILIDTLVNDYTLLPLTFKRIQETRTLNELIEYALDHRIEMQIMQKEHALAIEQRRAADRAYNPSLSAGASAGFKNGYEPNINSLRFNYSVGATLHVPIYDGGRRGKQRDLGDVEIQKALTSIELAKKEITNQVADSYLSLVSAWARIEQLNIQLGVSQQAYQQAKINYASGAITNLELLTSSTNATNSELLLLQEQINYQIAYYQLLVNIGECVYQAQ